MQVDNGEVAEEEEDEAAGAPASSLADAEQRQHLFKSGLPIARVLHVFDNVGKGLHESMSLWTEMSSKLDAVCAMLCQEQHRELFVQRCIRGFFPAYSEARAFEAPIERRWDSLMKTLRWLLDLEIALKASWHASRFGQVPASTRRRPSTFSPEQVSTAISDPGFWSYCMQVQHVLDQMSWWCEGCSCHPREWLHSISVLTSSAELSPS